jgi:hypothetical protein
MPVRGAFAAAFALVVLLVSGRASAWQEAHQTGDDVVARVDAAGVAQVQHTLHWHIVRGPLKTIDLVHVDAGARLQPDVPITGEDGRSLLAHVARREDGTIRISVDEPRALMRGNFAFDLRYELDLVAAHALVRDGSTWRLTWSSPVATEGFDAARTVLDFVAAPDAPQAILPDTGAVDDAAVATVVRQPGDDRLELVRPHVARGEAPTWTVRVDARALSAIPDHRGSVAAAASLPPEPDRIREVSLGAGLGALAVLFGLVVRRRARLFAAACATRGGGGGGLLPVADGLRAAIAGISLSAGIGLELAETPTAGAACIALSVLAVAIRPTIQGAAARGPGRWLALRPEDAFAVGPSTWTADALAVVVGGLVVGALAWAARGFDPEGPWLVVLDAAPLLALLLTGRASQLPPDRARTPARWLARAYEALRRAPGLRVAPWGRLPLETDAPDELRLLVLPRAAMPGVLGIELGLGWSSTLAGWASSPEVLARVLDGSPAAARLAREIPACRPVPGRRPDERVVRLRPRSATRAGAVALSRALAEALTDRREPAPASVWTAPERRVPRVRTAPVAAGAAA